MKDTFRNLVIIPSRGRPDSAQEASDLASNLGNSSEVIIAVDADDAHNYSRISRHETVITGTKGLTNALNGLAMRYAPNFETITFLGDDHRVRTQGWDTALSVSIQRRGYGFAYGDDLNMGETLPTSIMISTNIVLALGHFAPKELGHMFIDDYWKELGARCRALDYVPSVVIEHMHHSLGKSDFDNTYKNTNTLYNNLISKLKYRLYLITSISKEIGKINTLAH